MDGTDMLYDPLIEFQLSQLSRVWGKYAGKVVSNADDQQMGRLQVLCPAILGDAQVWARPCVPYAGPGVGSYFIPPEGSGVWIEFEGGDVSRAIWTGCYWAKGDLPEDASSADVKLIVTSTAKLMIDDGAGSVEISNQSESKTVWAADIASKAGDAKHSVGASGVMAESASGAGKVEVSDSGVSVNNGALSVM
jgi:uncharacterized protein involved in type VI secretion and phage assembly